jgi:hypothetical protein
MGHEAYAQRGQAQLGLNVAGVPDDKGDQPRYTRTLGPAAGTWTPRGGKEVTAVTACMGSNLNSALLGLLSGIVAAVEVC